MQHARIKAPSPFPRQRAARLAAAVGLFLGAFAMPACDGEDDTTNAIEQAQRTLASTHIGGAAATTEDFREQRYATVVSALRPVADSGSDAQRAAAQALLSQAQAGQADILAGRAQAMERDAMAEAATLRSAFENLVVGLRAQAAAGASGGASADQQQTATLARQVEAERAEAQSRLASLRSEIESIRRQMSAAEAAAAEARSREASLRAELLPAEGESRTDLAVRAVAAQREAAAYERERATLDSRLSVLQPEAEQVQREIDSLTTRIELLEASRGRMQSLDQTMRDRAAEDQRLASEAAERLVNDLAALDDMRESDLAGAWDSAISAYEQAIGSMRQASNAAPRTDRTAAMISLGSLQQSLGDLHGARARGQARYASLLERLLDAEPAMPRVGMIGQYIERVRNDEAAWREAARGAYEDARASYQQSGARGEVGARIDALVERLGADAAPGETGDQQG